MKRSGRLALVLSLLLAASGLGCGAETGNGMTSVRLALESTDSANTLQGSDLQGSVLAIEAAQGSLQDIELFFEEGTVCGDFELPEQERIGKCEGNKLTIEGPLVTDLVAGDSNPSLDSIVIPATTYRRVDVRFERARPEDGLIDGSHPLANKTLVATGELTSSGSTRSLEIALDFNADAKFESEGGITLEEDGANELLLSLDVAKWFSTLSITECSTQEGGSGTLVIDENLGARMGACRRVEPDLREAIRVSGRLR